MTKSLFTYAPVSGSLTSPRYPRVFLEITESAATVFDTMSKTLSETCMRSSVLVSEEPSVSVLSSHEASASRSVMAAKSIFLIDNDF